MCIRDSSNTTDVTQYALNIITLIGIGVSVDYSLFMVNRFREELNRGRDIRTSTAMTVATAGKAVFFSGVTVAIGLMGMLFFENTGLPSLGIGGTLAVSVAMIFSIVVLPAVLALLGNRVFKLKIPFSFSTDNDDGEGIWSKIATTVMGQTLADFTSNIDYLTRGRFALLTSRFLNSFERCTSTG